jgi:hypothetical protein
VIEEKEKAKESHEWRVLVNRCQMLEEIYD